eukprot:gnl/TRDRNA2_/TRDRNA2_65727_c0_seq1.p1 gnl/TRDRNA2_/TRDRNA2_65727_c0~~gnl/TRDRNA2_/TRDRNA2_65727_c0_seq1.p1  ORF type:complete len:432 (+),score=70.20 gnl/TRDRNA2_/TRDRNA2_65727_c0_seq1:31-1296(+)
MTADRRDAIMAEMTEDDMAVRGDMAEPWGPEACRQELLVSIETATFELLRAAVPAGTPAVSAGQWRSSRSFSKGGSGGDCLAKKLVTLLQKPRQCQPKRVLKSTALAPAPSRASNLDLRLRRLMAMLDSIHGLLTSGRHATPRELFYSHAALFSTQQQSDDILKMLCKMLEVPRHYLHIAGTAKGLVRGHLRILEPACGAPCSGETASLWVDGLDPFEARGHPISPICAHLARVESMARTVLVVEKETVFLRLLDEGILEEYRPFIMLTARGFPDLPTRYFLRRIREDCAAPHVLLLVDFDAFGLQIAMTYAFGPENAWNQDNLALPAAELLVCPEVSVATARYGLGADDTMPLAPRDCAIARGLLRRCEHLRNTHGVAIDPWEHAISQLLKGGIKYELDALDQLPELVRVGMRARASGIA